MELIELESIQIIPGLGKVIVQYRSAKDTARSYQMTDTAEIPYSPASDAFVKSVLIALKTKNSFGDIEEKRFPQISTDINQGR